MPTYQRFMLAAELLGIPPDDLATRLGQPSAGVSAKPPSPNRGSVKIHAKYLGQAVEAIFDPSANTVTIESGELAGKVYTSASSAAIAVVESINPGRESANTNGRLFWIVTETGQPLRSLLGRR